MKSVECIDSNNTSNALNALMIRKKCRLQLSPEEVETVPDPADHLGVNYRWLGQRPRTPDGCKCRADNVERQADAPGRAEMASSGKVGDLIT